MHSLLRRWLHKCYKLNDLNFRSSVRKDASQHMDHIEIPTKYVCEELASEFARYWTRIRENDGEGIEEIQRDALTRWHAFQFNFGEEIEQNPLPLDFLVEVFDDYFFLGSVRQYIKVSIADASPANSTWVGLTQSKNRDSLTEPPEIQIQLKRLPNQLWTRQLIQEVLDTLLHEMSHAFLMTYSTTAEYLGNWPYRKIAQTEGLTGHGPCWVKVAAAIAAEADRSLGGCWDKWELKIADSCNMEREALRESWNF